MLYRSKLLRVMIYPDQTLDPTTLGVRTVTDQSSADSVYGLLRNGHYVMCDVSLTRARDLLDEVRTFLTLEVPAVDFDMLQRQQRVQEEINSRFVIPREFWLLPDFIEIEGNTTFEGHSKLFLTHHWNHTIQKEFRAYAEEAYPISLHSHVPFSQYLSLLASFARYYHGVQYKALLGSTRLRPKFGVHVPSRHHLTHYALLLRWFSQYRRPFMLQRLLCLNSGCGIVPFMLGRFKSETIVATDTNPRSVESCADHALKIPKLSGRLKFTTAELFPPSSTLKHDCVIFSPDFLQMTHYERHETPYAPGMSGVDGQFENFFEHAHEYLRDWGVVVILYSNFRTLMEPTAPHPIELEVKKNRRWVVLDYFEAPMKVSPGSSDPQQHAGLDPEDTHYPHFLRQIRSKLRAEVWVLHTVDAIPNFGFVHGIPGSQPPAVVASAWQKRRLKFYRRRVMKTAAEALGVDQRELKDRFQSVLEDTDEPEDEEAQQLRYMLDPKGYVQQIERRRVEAQDAADEQRRLEADRIVSTYVAKSPREVFDESWAPKVRGGQNGAPSGNACVDHSAKKHVKPKKAPVATSL